MREFPVEFERRGVVTYMIITLCFDDECPVFIVPVDPDTVP